MSTKTQICNLALSHLGVAKEISNLEERSGEAQACSRFYDISREIVLNDMDWNFATGFLSLNLIEENPVTEWAYSYRYPVKCLNSRRILSGIRNDSAKTRVPYMISNDTAGRVIYTDTKDGVLEYTQNLEDSSLFTPEFVMALSFRLAAYISPRLTAGDPYKIKNDMIAQYHIEILNAKKQNFNENRDELPPESEFITTRN